MNNTTSDMLLSCHCKKIQGVAQNVSPKNGTHVVCYCDDCQKFAQYLNHEELVLDEYGGTEIFQMPIAHVKITSGAENIACMRLTEKGLYRWYSNCCRTPIGNTLSGNMPFIGIVHNFMENQTTRQSKLGKIRGYVHIKFAKKRLPQAYIKQASMFRIILRTVGKIIAWKVKGLNKPSAFFQKNAQPIVTPTIISSNDQTH